MPAPLIWLGAAALGIYATNEANTALLKRKGVVSVLPGEKKTRYQSVTVAPANGSVVCCGVYGLFDHTGVWVDGNIYELNGNGLVRCVSPERFLANRSGELIYVACDTDLSPLAESSAVPRVRDNLYQVLKYHLLRQNCHRFVAEMLSGERQNITSFSDLNEFLHGFFRRSISWQRAKIDFR